ncbi:hypothetical protein HPB51_005714 [Rhipicephalus microplus]|uniref:Uncharacterized protein n=1 Tax=Rhipicephalus microplus TaxID=6941 RepID=A0A9J6EML7_RHIMP|nr:hypothetical protein HPB51_005714 [Rhipicephalus microplus]
MVPTDGLCHHVYYTNLMVVESVLTPVKISLSWNMFKATVKTFRKTVGGVGFDVRYVDEVDLQAEVREQLYKLNTHNVRHYGILNVLETSSKLKDLFNKARRLLTSESEARRKALDVKVWQEALEPEIAPEKGPRILERIKVEYAENEALAGLEVETMSKDAPCVEEESASSPNGPSKMLETSFVPQEYVSTSSNVGMISTVPNQSEDATLQECSDAVREGPVNGFISVDKAKLARQSFVTQSAKSAIGREDLAPAPTSFPTFEVPKRHDDDIEGKEILKRFQEARDVYGKTILAFGIYNYLGHRAWETLQEVFTSAVENSVADTVIAYSSVGWIEEPSECFSHPPSIFNKSRYIAGARKEAGRAPDIFTVSRLMTADKRFKTAVKVGLSFELGTLIYEVKEKAINFDMVNAPCKSLYVASLDAVPCRNDPYSMRGELFQGVNVAELRDFRKTIIFFEDDITIAQKCRQLALRSTNLRFGMALLLVNAHLGDFSVNSTCAAYGEKDREDPFWRIKVIRTELNIA